MAVHAVETVLETPGEPTEGTLQISPELAAAFARFDRELQNDAAAGVLTPPPPPRVIVRRALPDREILGAMAGLGSVLAVRLMLLMAVVGAFALAWQAMPSPSLTAICLVLAYAATVVLPLVWLATKRT
jgi:hypothetical protein